MNTLHCKHLGLRDYTQVWQAMSDYTDQRHADSEDQLWLVQHPAVFTQGQAGKAEHILDAGDIPIVQSDRGGQVTYHGPGQLVGYLLIDVKRKGWSTREFVQRIEHAVIETLCHYAIDSYADRDAPGVYVGEAKISALGLRLRKGRSLHGLSLNVDMDMSPYARINPCGYTRPVAQLRDFTNNWQWPALMRRLSYALCAQLDYQHLIQSRRPAYN